MLCALAVCIFTACQVAPTTTAITVNGAKQVYAGEFDLADYSIVVATSDGNMRTEPLTAQNLANVTVEQLQKAGEYDISVVYDGVTITFTLTVVNRTFDGLAFADKTVTYDGTAQTIEVVNLPQGATVSYSPSNSYTNAGMYPVTATVSAPDFDTITLSATLTIDKATYDMSKVVFENKSVTYDGTTHSLEATNLPDGVTVTYQNNEQVNAGSYMVTACFAGDEENYNAIANKTATLTIVPSDIKGITFAGKTVTYDGVAHFLAIEGTLPEGVAVFYQNNGKTNAGTYTVIAHFTSTNDNYKTLADMNATLTIEKATYDMSQVVFENKSVTYDGNSHSLEATNLPDGVSVAYIGNNQTNVGTYTVLAVFSGDSVNYNAIANMSATLTIVQSTVQGITFADAIITYDGTVHSLAVVGDLPQGIAVIYENNNQTNAGVYTVTAKFVGTNPNYEQLPDMTATLTINKRDLTIEFVGATTIVYDGNAHKSLTARATNLCGNDTVDINISYSGDMVEAGTYTATATVNEVNYQLTDNNTCTLTITRATHKVTFRQSGQPDKVYDVLDLADFAEAFPEVVAVAGYDVVWETKDLTRITNDVIVNVVITPTVYSITYILYGGTNPYDAPRRYTIETPTFALPVPQRDCFAFEGWYTEESLVNKIEQILQGSIGNVTLYAKWQRTSTEGLKYEQLQDGSYAVSGYDGDSDEVLIASVWRGQSVTAIGELAFGDRSRFTSVIIPDSVTSIGDWAFFGCAGLTSVTIGSGVTSIGKNAFYKCSNLTEIRYNGNLIGWCSISDLSQLMVYGNSTKALYIDGTEIEGNLVIPEGVTSIGDYAFFGCTGLTSVTIPDSINYVGSSAFDGCNSLVYNQYDNAYYLGNATNKYVILVKAVSAGITSCVINSKCKIVVGAAFLDCSGLKNITIPDGVTSISGVAFV